MINHNRKHLRVFIKHLVLVDFLPTIFDFTEVNSKTMSNATNNITLTTPYVFQLFDNTTLPVFVIFACIAWLVNISLLITIFIDRLHCFKKGSGWFVASMGITSIIMGLPQLLYYITSLLLLSSPCRCSQSTQSVTVTIGHFHGTTRNAAVYSHCIYRAICFDDQADTIQSIYDRIKNEVHNNFGVDSITW